jgi:hypothetical protein
MINSRRMPREATTQPAVEYDPARRERIHELVERIRAAEDPAEVPRLEEELAEFIFGPAEA